MFNLLMLHVTSRHKRLKTLPVTEYIQEIEALDEMMNK